MQTVIIVDDEKVIRVGLKRLLSAEGYRVLTAENGREALALVRSENVDVVLCDLKMPVMGAVEVLEEVGATHPGLPVIVLTGQGTVENAVECMKKGAYDFVTKPFRTDYVLSVIKSAVERLPPPPKFQKLPF
jgi:two-component system, OmpR family, phosphate regulon sensor histidine kinase PhoR